jgi:hypothetical protein
MTPTALNPLSAGSQPSLTTPTTLNPMSAGTLALTPTPAFAPEQLSFTTTTIPDLPTSTDDFSISVANGLITANSAEVTAIYDDAWIDSFLTS